jgi:hypothetical protein
MSEKYVDYCFRFNIFSIKMSNTTKPRKTRVVSLAETNVKKVWIKDKWRRLCVAEDCENQVQIGNLCIRHFTDNEKKKKSASSNAHFDWDKPCDKPKNARLCSVSFCNKYGPKDGLCWRHFTERENQGKSTGNIEITPINRRDDKHNGIQTCSVENCDKDARKNHLCIQHFRENKKQRKSTSSTTITNQSSIHSSIEETDITSNNSNDSVVLTKNHPQSNTLDDHREFFYFVYSTCL